jgi:hypothetical protein
MTKSTEDDAPKGRLTFDAEGRLKLGGFEIVSDISPPPRRPSKSGSFTIVKTNNFLAHYTDLAARCKPFGLLELGIHQGGSYVLFDQLFHPQAISSIDISAPVAPLVEYAEAQAHRRLYFKSSQSDEALLKHIVYSDFQHRLDLVVDDASHDYELTKRSFEILFPLLRPGGYYVIEDWSWSHAPGSQKAGGYRWGEQALTNLIFEIVVLLGSTSAIDEIRLNRNIAEIRKSPQLTNSSLPWKLMRLRDRKMPHI